MGSPDTANRPVTPHEMRAEGLRMMDQLSDLLRSLAERLEGAADESGRVDPAALSHVARELQVNAGTARTLESVFAQLHKIDATHN